MTATDFYDVEVFSADLDFSEIVIEGEAPPPLRTDRVPLLLTAAAVTVAGVLTLTAPIVSFTTALDWTQNSRRPTPEVSSVAVPGAHRAAAERFRKMFRAVPLTKAEKIADPDFDL